MRKGDKVISIFFIFLAVSFVSVILHFDSNLMHRDIIDILPRPTTELEIEREIEIEKTKIFEVMTNISDYPKILPRNIVSVKIIENYENVLIAEEVLTEAGIKVKFLVKHTITPFEKHVIEILDGDAKGTKITQTFQEKNSSTKIITKVDLNLQGLMIPFGYIPKANLQHATNTVISDFVLYAQGFESISQKTVDDLYREILLRSADIESLIHYSTLIDKGELSQSELENILLQSEERNFLLDSLEIKALNELEDNSKNIVHKLYQDILYRNADDEGLRYYASQLESGKMTEDDIRLTLFNSEEGYNIRVNTNEKRLVNDLYSEFFHRHATQFELDYYENELRSKHVDEFELREIIINLSKNVVTENLQ